MLDDLERLKRLVLTDEYDEDSKQQVRDLEARLHRLTATENLASHDVMAEYMAHLKAEIAQCKELLSEDDKLTEAERNTLFERKRQAREFLGRFDTSARVELEKTIKDLLNVNAPQPR